MKFTSIVFVSLCVAASAAPLELSDRAGKTIFAVGQNYIAEWNGFANSIKKPAGISVYGNIYDGVLNRESEELLANYAKSSNGYVEVGLSWKDEMTNRGYSIYDGARLCNDIAAGKYDASLQKLGSYMRGFPNVKFLVRPDYEVSGNLHANTNPSQFDPATWDYQAYPKAFAKVRQVLRGSVQNVEFMFHPVRGSAKSLYPGDSVVDYQGFSIFNNDVCIPVGSTRNCDGSRIDPNILLDIEFAKKPKWIAESAPQPPASGSPSSYIDYMPRVRDLVEKYDFAGWTYINSNWPAHGWPTDTWGDTRIEANPSVLEWFRTNISGNGRYVFG